MAVLVGAVGVARAVLGDVQLWHAIVGSDAHQQVIQPVRIDLPVHLGPFFAWRADDGEWRVLCLGYNPAARHLTRVVVDAQEISRRGDRLEVAVTQPRRARWR